MSVQSDIEEVKAALEAHEADLKQVRRSAIKLHNLLSAKFAANAEALGLTQDEAIAMGGGTDKPD